MPHESRINGRGSGRLVERDDGQVLQSIAKSDPDPLVMLYDRYGRLAFGLAMLGWNLSLHQSSNQQVVALQPAAGVSGAGGQLIYLKDQQVMIVKPQGLPSLAPGKVYEVWLIQGNTPIAAGVLDRSSGQVAVAANMNQYQALAITVENGPLGSSTPTGQKVIVTPF